MGQEERVVIKKLYLGSCLKSVLGLGIVIGFVLAVLVFIGLVTDFIHISSDSGQSPSNTLLIALGVWIGIIVIALIKTIIVVGFYNFIAKHGWGINVGFAEFEEAH